MGHKTTILSILKKKNLNTPQYYEIKGNSITYSIIISLEGETQKIESINFKSKRSRNLIKDYCVIIL